MKTPYSIALFDLDGTVNESHRGVTRCVAYAIEKMGFPPLPMETLKKFVGPPMMYSFPKFCGMTQEESQKALDLFHSVYDHDGIYENSVFPGIRELWKDLRNAGMKVAVATSKPQSAADEVVRYFGLTELVDFVSGAYEDDRPHTKADLILKACRNFQIAPENAVMVGDTQFDAAGAQGAKTHFIGVLYGYGSREEMEQYGAHVFASTVEELHALLLP